jgi:hypothetical protein
VVQIICTNTGFGIKGVRKVFVFSLPPLLSCSVQSCQVFVFVFVFVFDFVFIFGLWSLVFGLWSLVFGLWSLVFGLCFWSLDFGFLSLLLILVVVLILVFRLVFVVSRCDDLSLILSSATYLYVTLYCNYLLILKLGLTDIVTIFSPYAYSLNLCC